jgi:tetratricopeptide (TPR) repeat protein
MSVRRLPELSPNEWARARVLFDEAVSLAADERAEFVSTRCSGDPSLRAALDALLEADAAPGTILDASPEDLSCLLADEAGLPGFRPGDTIDRYTIERELGHGGHGVVYLAHDPKHGRYVALKMLQPELALTLRVERFLREIRIAAALSHPHILPLHDSGEIRGVLYYVMPYVEGESLRDRLQRERQLPVEDALRIAREVADALNYAHQHGVIHRDIKPENILLHANHALVADFGVARALSAAGNQALVEAEPSAAELTVPDAGVSGRRTVTDSGIAIGTPAYMSPEQIAGSVELDGRSDVYSLGCVVYEMVAGRRPFEGEAIDDLQARIQADPLPPLPSSLDRDLARVVRQALAREPSLRFVDAGQMLRQLDRCARPRRRARWVVVGATAIALAAAAFFGARSGSGVDAPLLDVTTRSPTAYRLFEEGLRQLAAGEGRAAYARFASALREDTTFALAGFHALLAAYTTGSLSSDSITRMGIALAQRAPRRERLLIQTLIAAQLRRSLTAISDAESLRTLYTRDPTARLLAGQVSWLRGHYPEAIDEARVIRDRSREGSRGTRSPLQQWHESEATQLLLDAYVWMDSLPAAEREARRFLEVHPDNENILLRLSNVLKLEGRFSEARSIVHDPSGPETEALDLAQLAIWAGDLDRAERDLADLSRTLEASSRGWARWIRGIAIRNQGRPHAALAIALRGRLPTDRGLEPTTEGVGAVQEGIARFEIGELQRAAAIFEDLAARAPQDLPDRKAWWLTHVATAVAAAGDTVRLAGLVDSIQAFGARSLFGRDQVLHYYVRGLLDVARGRDAEAVVHFRAAIVSPNLGFTRVNYELGRALCRLGRPAEAAAIVGAALRGSLDASNLYITHTELHELLAQAHEAAGQRDSARVHYRIVVNSWARAEAEFRPRRAEAARRLAALGG